MFSNVNGFLMIFAPNIPLHLSSMVKGYKAWILKCVHTLHFGKEVKHSRIARLCSIGESFYPKVLYRIVFAVVLSNETPHESY